MREVFQNCPHFASCGIYILLEAFCFLVKRPPKIDCYINMSIMEGLKLYESIKSCHVTGFGTD
jgi:hypothetical protein